MLRYHEGGNRTTAQRAGVKTLKIGAKVGAYAVSFPPNFIAPLTHKIVEATPGCICIVGITKRLWLSLSRWKRSLADRTGNLERFVTACQGTKSD